MVADVDLLKDNGNVELLGQLGDGLVTVLFKDVENDQSRNADITKSLGDVTTKSSGSSVEFVSN